MTTNGKTGVGLMMAIAMTGLVSATAEAQVIGTFSWQMQPYCNVVSVTVTQNGARYTLDGIDDQCGAAQQASARGMAFVNPDGTIGFGFTVIPPNALPVEISANISLGTLSGTWRDDAGQSGAFVFNGSAAGSPRPVGQIRIAVSPGEWRPFNSADNLTFAMFSNTLQVTKATIGTNFVSLHPSIPTLIRGLRPRLLGVELCYRASATVPLQRVEINTITNNTPASLGSVDFRFTDTTSRTGPECRFYALATPYALSQDDAVNFFIRPNWTVANTVFEIHRTTFIFAPTVATGVAPAIASGLPTTVLLPDSVTSTSASKPQ